MDWMKIVGALAMVMFIVYLFPKAKYMIQNSPKGSYSDWMGFVIPLVGIILFIMLLIKMV